MNDESLDDVIAEKQKVVSDLRIHNETLHSKLQADRVRQARLRQLDAEERRLKKENAAMEGRPYDEYADDD